MSNALFYPRLERCYRFGRDLVQEILAEWGLWAGQERVLLAIPQDQITIQSELSRKLCMDERTLHRTLKCLQRYHYIKLLESPTDMRVASILLTSMGARAVGAIEHTYREVAKLMCVGLDTKERAELCRLLELATRREYELRARQPALRDFLDCGRFS